jgi:regulatory protein
MTKEAYNYAIFLLSRRDYSIYKMRMKLRSRKYDEDVIDEVVKKLIDQNYLRENEYKKIRIKTLLLKGFSNSYIIRKLNQEMLETDNDQINSIREDQNIDAQESIEYLVQKKLRGKSIPKTFEEKIKLQKKILTFLCSKGYTYDQAQNAYTNVVNSQLTQSF